MLHPQLQCPAANYIVTILLLGEKRHSDPARIWTWVLWILFRCSYQWAIGALALEQLMADTVWFSGWISLRLGELCMISIPKYFVLPPANWVIAGATLYVPSEPSFIGADQKHFSFRRKAIQSAYARLRLWCWKVFLFAELHDGKKKTSCNSANKYTLQYCYLLYKFYVPLWW